ncbi:hypothetical protein [Palleronia sp. LCG004]|uniref:hypothetical protein n=1 Tax=Palleronia sp. LCG004 TaxID=3079304 RepID=UPI0029426CB8|nr:hypothetical protein [Palleronia sp. LCG004]WOI56869.1 hypothetical protein RVY76_03480 [Palleronia sp. LCG004]
MLKSLICAVALGGFAATADAAVYRYDVTMERTFLGLPFLQGTGSGMPEIVPEGIDCTLEGDAQSLEHVCEGPAGFPEDPADDFYRENFPETISASLFIDIVANVFVGPGCIGSSTLCGNGFVSSADQTGFSYIKFEGSDGGFIIDQDGLFYADDATYQFTLGNTFYSPLGGVTQGVTIQYATTSLDIISPIPLPAGAGLLSTALVILGWRRRQARSVS